MSSVSTPRRLTAEQPGDLLALMPYLLGYHPEESVVMAVVTGRQLGVCVRVDIGEDPSAIADRFADIADRNAADGVLLVAYSSDPTRADRHLEAGIDRLDRFGVIDALYVDGRRWWSRICNGDCCPAEGTPYEIDSNRLAAEAVFAGMSTVADRSEIEKLVRGPDQASTDRLDPMVESTLDEVLALPVAERRRRLRAWLTDYLRRRRRGETLVPAEEDLLRLACLVVDLLVRDEAWTMITRSTAEIHAELWQRVVAIAVPPLEPGPLCLLGMAAWAAGQGTLQVCCLERVRAVDATYTMADLLEDINARAIPPAVWDDVRVGLREAMAEQAAGQADRGRSDRAQWHDWGTPWTGRGRSRTRDERLARRRSARATRRRARQDRGGDHRRPRTDR
jgi:hypothetical protein